MPPDPTPDEKKAVAQLGRLVATMKGSEAGAPTGYLDRLDLSGLDVRGQASTAFSDGGTALSLTGRFNFGDTLVPGLISLPVAGTVKGARVTRGLLALQRLPRTLTRVRELDLERAMPAAVAKAREDQATARATSSGEANAPVSAPPTPPPATPPAAAPPGPPPAYTTTTPISLELYMGTLWEAELSFSADFFVGPPETTAVEVNAGAGAGVKVVGRRYSAVDTAPSFYTSPRDPPLIAAVSALFQRQLKFEVLTWLDELAVQQPSLASQAFSALKARLPTEAVQALADAGTNRVEVNEKRTSADVRGLVDAIVARATRLKTAEVVEALTALKDALVGDTNGALIADAGKRSFLIGCCDRFVLSLNAEKALKDARPSKPLTKRLANALNPRTKRSGQNPDWISYVDMWSVEGGARARVSANATAGVEKKYVDDDDETQRPNPTGTKLGVEASAEVQGSLARVASRMQSALDASASRPFLMTRDTVVNYAQISGEAAFNLGVAEATTATPANLATWKKIAWNRVRYRSVVVHWGYSPTPRALPCGSGISYGISVDIRRVTRAATQLRDGNLTPKSAAFIAMLVEQLHVPEASVKAFLKNVTFRQGEITGQDLSKYTTDPTADTLRKTVGDGPQAVLIEAAYAFTEPFDLPIDAKSKRLKSLHDLASMQALEKLTTPAQLAQPQLTPTGYEPPLAGQALQLESIRLRVRLADTLDRSSNLFQLGFTAVFGLGVGVDLVRRAGAQGAFDLYTWIADQKARKQPSLLNGLQQELLVPPVVFAHE